MKDASRTPRELHLWPYTGEQLLERLEQLATFRGENVAVQVFLFGHFMRLSTKDDALMAKDRLSAANLLPAERANFFD